MINNGIAVISNAGESMRAAVDYDIIRERNLKAYGDERAILAERCSRTSTPSGPTSSLELLQNAEDARRHNGVGASRIRFDLRRDRLRVFHDGRPFTPTDVHAICSVGDSSKEDETNTIGSLRNRLQVGLRLHRLSHGALPAGALPNPPVCRSDRRPRGAAARSLDHGLRVRVRQAGR